MLGFAVQGWFLRKSTAIESALFLAGGLLFVFPSVLDAVVRPLTGIALDAFLPGLSDLGIRMGPNVPLGLAAFVAAALLQRTRRQRVPA
jgi:hypothetical protein